MKHPLQITARNMSLSEAAKAAIQEKAAKLDAVDDGIIGCRVLVELPHKHHHQGARYNVRIDLTIPGAELVVTREPHEDLYVAIRDAFDAARRQLRERRNQRINGADVRETVRHPADRPPDDED
jgi:ribosomal subunit interface protein